MHRESYCSFCFKGVLGDRPTFMRLTPTFMRMPDQRVMPPVSLYKLLLMNESVLSGLQSGLRPGGGGSVPRLLGEVLLNHSPRLVCPWICRYFTLPENLYIYLGFLKGPW